MTPEKPHCLQLGSLYTQAPKTKTQKQGLGAESAVGGPIGSQREPKDLSEATVPPTLRLAEGATTWGTASIQLYPTQSCMTSRLQNRPWAPKRSRSSALCKAMLVPTSRLCSSLKRDLVSLLPTQSPALLTPYAFSGDARPFSELMSLRGTAVAWPYCPHTP